MRLLYYTHVFLPTVGGAELMLHNLALRMTSFGHDVAVLAPRVRGADNRIDAPYRIVRYQRPSSKRICVRQTLFNLAREKLLRGFDVLHCHGAYPAGYVGSAFKRLFGVPLVIRPHGADILPGEHIRCKAYLERRMVGALRHADVVIAQSLELENIALELGVNERNIVNIPNGVNIGLYRDRPERPRAGTPYILALGSLTPKKGIDILIRAMAELRLNGSGVRLVVAGDGPLRGELTALIAELGLENRVEMPGILRGTEKVDAVKSCMFGVSSSRREPFSNSNLEFMAAGKPLVVTGVGGNAEVVHDGVNGLVVDKEDPSALAAAIERLIRDEGLRNRMSVESSRLVKRYDIDIIARHYEKVYTELVK